MEFDAQTFAVDGTEVVRITGELDLASAPELERVLSAVDRPHVVVDASELSFVDVVGLSALVRCHQAADGDGRRLVVRGASPALRRILDVTGLDRSLVLDDGA